MSDVPTFTTVTLETGPDGRSRFREDIVRLAEGKPAFHLSVTSPGSGLQFRQSPPGYATDFHNSIDHTWVFVLAGRLEIGLVDGTSRTFGPGDHFHAQDTLPLGATFDASVHGHNSRTVGDEPVVTAFVIG